MITVIEGATNNSNKKFYEDIKLELADLAKSSGLTSGLDITRLQSYIQKANRILEIGAGYGRAAHFIDQLKSPSADLYLIENVSFFTQILRTQFPDSKILESNFNELICSKHLKHNFDLILWMWSGFADFNTDEQQQSLSKVESLLSSDGTFVIDLPAIEKTNASEIVKTTKGNNASIHLDQIASYTGFIPTFESLTAYLEKTNLSLTKTQHYQTLSFRERVQYFIVKT